MNNYKFFINIFEWWIIAEREREEIFFFREIILDK